MSFGSCPTMSCCFPLPTFSVSSRSVCNITSRFVWPGINTDVRNWARLCLQCQHSKVQRHTVTPLGTFTTPDARFDMIHLDIVGPLPPSQGYRYLLTIIDHFTRWPEAIPVADIRAPTVAQAFVHTWVSRFGVPSTVTTDCGWQFESALWQHLMQTLGSTHIRTTAYHLTSNGLIECFHHQLKALLRVCPNPSHWVNALPLVLLDVRTALKEDLGCSSAELVYGAYQVNTSVKRIKFYESHREAGQHSPVM